MSGAPWWLALLDEPPELADATAEARTLDGRPAGVLAAWRDERDAPVGAAKVDPRLIDPEGAPAVVSLVLVPPAIRIPFDDPAVAGARRAVLAGPPRRALSTLVIGDSRFAGAITAARDGEEARLADDPFARLAPARVLSVGPGLLGQTSMPAGPVIERYGGARPWPWDRFAR